MSANNKFQNNYLKKIILTHPAQIFVDTLIDNWNSITMAIHKVTIISNPSKLCYKFNDISVFYNL